MSELGPKGRQSCLAWALALQRNRSGLCRPGSRLSLVWPPNRAWRRPLQYLLCRSVRSTVSSHPRCPLSSQIARERLIQALVLGKET